MQVGIKSLKKWPGRPLRPEMLVSLGMEQEVVEGGGGRLSQGLKGCNGCLQLLLR